jgi:hypothetical protein
MVKSKSDSCILSLSKNSSSLTVLAKAKPSDIDAFANKPKQKPSIETEPTSTDSSTVIQIKNNILIANEKISRRQASTQRLEEFFAMANKNKYTNKTLIGNWYEQRIMEDVAKQSSTINNCDIRDFFQKHVSFSESSSDQCVFYDDKIILRFLGNNQVETKQCSVLNIDFYRSNILNSKYLASLRPDGCFDHSTVFKIERVQKNTRSDCTVRCNQNFYLTTLDNSLSLYTMFEPMSESEMSVAFAKRDSLACRNFEWTFVAYDMTDGPPVRSKQLVSIKHVATGRYLNVKPNKFELSCESRYSKYVDKQYTGKWQIITHQNRSVANDHANSSM